MAKYSAVCIFCIATIGMMGIFPIVASQNTSQDSVSLVFDSNEAEQVLSLLQLRRSGRDIPESEWQKLFTCRPYLRLKKREAVIGEMFRNPKNVFDDEDFKKFILSESLLLRYQELRKALERWGKVDLERTASRVLQYLPKGAVIQSSVYPMIKPRENSFVWEMDTDPAIFLYLAPEISGEKFENTVAHEMHHIGLSSLEDEYNEKIESLDDKAKSAARWMGAFGEGFAMLAAAGGPDCHPHSVSSIEERNRWNGDMANFAHDLREVDAFFLSIVNGDFADDEAVTAKGSSYFGVQGAWYTVGYKMAVTVEKCYGRKLLLETMLDPRLLLIHYNRAVQELNSKCESPLPLWSQEILHKTFPQWEKGDVTR